MRELYCGYVLLRILYSERGYCERNKGNIQRVLYRLYALIFLYNKNEGPDNLSGGCSPHSVNHLYLCLYCIVYILYFNYAFLFYFISPRSNFSNIEEYYINPK
jgi:hypothetical protein